MDYIIRNANDGDKLSIARTIAYSFNKEFKGLCKEPERLARVFENGIKTSRFVVAEINGKIVGISGCSDCSIRAVMPTKKDSKKYLGFIRGFIAYQVFYDEFIKPIQYPATTGYIEIVGVLPEARGKGIAKAMLASSVEVNTQYSEFVLNVTDVNTIAQKLYEGFGFVEYERIPYKYAKQAGFNAKIYMRYTR